MKSTEVATFKLDTFRVKSFSFSEPEDRLKPSIGIRFEPEGLFDEKNKTFELTLLFKAIENMDSNKNHPIIQATLSADFIFNKPIKIEEIPSYFYKNAIAIIFPYLRSFISTLTLQAGSKLIILPVMNLSSLEKPLKDNTKIIST